MLGAYRGRRIHLVVAVVAALCASGGMASAASADTPTFSVGDASVVEGTGAAPTTMTFTVTLDGTIPAGGATVKWRTSTLTATDGVDFTPQIDPTLLTFPEDGKTTRAQTVSVPITADSTNEYDETFQVVLTDATGATGSVIIGDALGVGTIIDDDAPPSVSIADASATEGTGNFTNMIFTVSLSAASGKTIKVDWTAAPGTALDSGANADYTPPNPPVSTITFLPGVVSQQVIVQVVGDAVDEPDETFGVTLSNARNNLNPPFPVNGSDPTISHATATGTIVDDDGPAISVADASVTEGPAGSSQVANVTVTLDKASEHPVGFSYATADDTATAPADYDAVSTPVPVVIPAGALTATFPITVRGDDLDEADENVKINLSAPLHGRLQRATGALTIKDSSPSPTIRIGDASVVEGTGGAKSVTLTATLSPPSGRTLQIRYTTRDVTATGGVDYQQSSDVLTFAPGETSKTFSIAIGTDDALEDDETFAVDFAYAAGDGPPIPSATVTIVDDDLTAANTPKLSISDASVREGDSGTRDAVFTVSLAAPSTRTVTARYATADGTARAPGDYTARSGTVTIPAGKVEQTISVPVRGDTVREPNEDFAVVLSGVRNAKATSTRGQGVITDDDAGLDSAGVTPRRAAASTVLCRRGAPCGGLRVRWKVAARGTVRVGITSLLPPAGGKASRAGKKKATPRPVRLHLLTRTFKVTKPGSGHARVSMRPSALATKLLQKLKAAKAKTLTVTVTFTNTIGAAQTATFVVKLR